jgi:hypothetical protein
LVPAAVSAYAPRGQTPVVHCPYWEHLSVISAITSEGELYTMTREKAFDGQAIVQLLKHLSRQNGGGKMSQITSAGDGMSPETRRRIVRWIVQAPLGVVGYAALLFLTSGSVTWLWGLVLIAVLAAFLAAHPILLIPINSELLAEREKGQLAEGVKAWDKLVSILAGGAFPVASWVVAALGFRFGWTAGISRPLHLVGLA